MSLDAFGRIPLLFGPSPVHPLHRLSEHLGGKVEIWANRFGKVETVEPAPHQPGPAAEKERGEMLPMSPSTTG